MADEQPKQTVVNKVKFTGGFECPYDLDSVFQLQFNSDNMKGVLSWIIEHLG